MPTTFRFEPSGKIQLPSDEELVAMDADNAILAYSTGTMQDGRNFYAYIAVKPSKYKEFMQYSREKKDIILNQYGKILVSGFASQAPKDVVEHMRETYGCDENFEKNLVQSAITQQKQHLQKQEEVRIGDIVTMLKKRKP